jgi:hypothetical protein
VADDDHVLAVLAAPLKKKKGKKTAAAATVAAAVRRIVSLSLSSLIWLRVLGWLAGVFSLRSPDPS